MRLHLALPHTHTLDARGVSLPRLTPAEDRGRWQRAKDLLAAGIVMLLVLATAVVILSYAIHSAPRWRTGNVTVFEPTPAAYVAPDASATAAASETPVASSISRVSLILISTVVEMAIFVALGLYLRHDLNRKP